MGTAEDYLTGLEARLTADGCTVDHAEVGGYPALVARRSDFRLRWMATRLHLFTIAIVRPKIDAGELLGFTADASRYAKKAKPGLPVMLQTGVGLFPAVICAEPSPLAVTAARKEQQVTFGCMARPVVVTPDDGRATWFQGKPALGRFYHSHFIEKGRRYFHET